jgi:hypothetical protein
MSFGMTIMNRTLDRLQRSWRLVALVHHVVTSIGWLRAHRDRGHDQWSWLSHKRDDPRLVDVDLAVAAGLAARRSHSWLVILPAAIAKSSGSGVSALESTRGQAGSKPNSNPSNAEDKKSGAWYERASRLGAVAGIFECRYCIAASPGSW